MASPSGQRGIVFGFDLSSRFGVAAVDRAGALLRSLAVDCRLKPKDHPGMRYVRARAAIDDLAKSVGMPTTVGYEVVRSHRTKNGFATEAAHVYGGMLGVVLSWCADHGVEAVPVEVSHWKMGIGASGNADKNAVLRVLRAVGFTPASQDEADAIGIALWTERNARWSHMAALKR